MFYLFLYLGFGLLAYCVLALVEYVHDPEIPLKNKKEMVVLFLRFVVLWPWVIPFYMYERMQ